VSAVHLVWGQGETPVVPHHHALPHPRVLPCIECGTTPSHDEGGMAHSGCEGVLCASCGPYVRASLGIHEGGTGCVHLLLAVLHAVGNMCLQYSSAHTIVCA
jgi:hypothetical protein